MVYAAAPWLLRRVARHAHVAPFNEADPGARGWARHLAGNALLFGAVACVTPLGSLLLAVTVSLFAIAALGAYLLWRGGLLRRAGLGRGPRASDVPPGLALAAAASTTTSTTAAARLAGSWLAFLATRPARFGGRRSASCLGEPTLALVAAVARAGTGGSTVGTGTSRRRTGVADLGLGRGGRRTVSVGRHRSR